MEEHFGAPSSKVVAWNCGETSCKCLKVKFLDFLDTFQFSHTKSDCQIVFIFSKFCTQPNSNFQNLFEGNSNFKGRTNHTSDDKSERGKGQTGEIVTWKWIFMFMLSCLLRVKSNCNLAKSLLWSTVRITGNKARTNSGSQNVYAILTMIIILRILLEWFYSLFIIIHGIGYVQISLGILSLAECKIENLTWMRKLKTSKGNLKRELFKHFQHISPTMV